MMRFSPWANRRIAIGALVLLLLSTVSTAVRAIAADHTAATASSPAATVRQFLADTLIDGDGYQGCRYVRVGEQQSVARRAGSPASCADALNTARLRLGGETFTTSRQLLLGLSVATRRVGRHAQVRIAHGGQALVMTLAPATALERMEFGAPPTPWRIVGGVTPLVPKPSR